MDLLYVRYVKVLTLNKNVPDCRINPKVVLTSLKGEVTSHCPINRIVSIIASDNQPRKLLLRIMTLTNTVMIGAIMEQEVEDHATVIMMVHSSGAVPLVVWIII